MRSISLLAPAKINLYLEIIGDAGGGYHELAMVFQSIDLADVVTLRTIGIDDFRIRCDAKEVPLDNTNLAYKAAALMAKQFPKAFAQYGGAEITIEKHIPVAAGLAGGSANAAAVLVGLDLLWQLGQTVPELQQLGAKLGADVPFCISGGTALGTGRGDELEPLPDVDNLYVVLAKYRNLQVSTAWAYQTYRQQFGSSYVSAPEQLQQRRQRLHSGPMVGAIARKDGHKIAQLLHNDLEKVVLPAHPPVARLRAAFAAEKGVLGTMMSGSGPTVFALTPDLSSAQRVRQQVQTTLNDPDLGFWVAKCLPNGIQLSR